MKRSTIINEMVELVHDMPREFTVYDQCEKLLSLLEAHGIAVPPPITRPLTKEESKMIKIKGVSKIEVSEWEAESDNLSWGEKVDIL